MRTVRSRTSDDVSISAPDMQMRGWPCSSSGDRMPTCVAMLHAVSRPSPVIMDTDTPLLRRYLRRPSRNALVTTCHAATHARTHTRRARVHTAVRTQRKVEQTGAGGPACRRGLRSTTHPSGWHRSRAPTPSGRASPVPLPRRRCEPCTITHRHAVSTQRRGKRRGVVRTISRV